MRKYWSQFVFLPLELVYFFHDFIVFLLFTGMFFLFILISTGCF